MARASRHQRRSGPYGHDRSLADGSRTPSGGTSGPGHPARLLRRARPPGGHPRGERRGGVPAPARRRGDQQRGDGAALVDAAARHASPCARRLPVGTRSRAHAPDGIGRARGRYVAAAAAAYLTLARADTAGAIRRLGALPRDDCPRCYLDRVVLAQLLVEVGRDAEAWDLLQADLPSATLGPFAERGAVEPASRPGRGADRRARASDPVLLLGRGDVAAAGSGAGALRRRGPGGPREAHRGEAVGLSSTPRRAGPGPRAPRPAVPRGCTGPTPARCRS